MGIEGSYSRIRNTLIYKEHGAGSTTPCRIQVQEFTRAIALDKLLWRRGRRDRCSEAVSAGMTMRKLV